MKYKRLTTSIDYVIVDEDGNWVARLFTEQNAEFFVQALNRDELWEEMEAFVTRMSETHCTCQGDYICPRCTAKDILVKIKGAE